MHMCKATEMKHKKFNHLEQNKLRNSMVLIQIYPNQTCVQNWTYKHGLDVPCLDSSSLI
jgi:hypothetical protein